MTVLEVFGKNELFPLEIDIVYLDAHWQDKQVQNLVIASIEKAMQVITPVVIGPCEICVVLSNDEAQRQLNSKWRKLDKTTNVLSFPQIDAFAPLCGMMGDIVLARQTIISEAKTQQKPFADHFAHLVLHGFLHILGYDHENDKDAKQMESLEIDILMQIGIDNPYED
ncbi:MAG: rRNA maturation RNase YbeY [Rhodobacteraceae bacterium]|nr:rRNA maturation RNase YbeY [Paracoccaceae bacterium]